MTSSRGEKSVCEEGTSSGITCPTIVEDGPSYHTSREASRSCSIQEALLVSPKQQPISTNKMESCPSPCSVLDETYDQQRVMDQQDQSKGRIMAAVPFSLDDTPCSVKVTDYDVSTIATYTTTASSSTASICSTSSSSSQREQVNVNAKLASKPIPELSSPLNNKNNNNRYEYIVTIRMPVVAEECMKWQTIRKTILQAKLQSKQMKKDNQFQAVCWIACFLLSIVYHEKMGRILATLPYATLAVIIMK